MTVHEIENRVGRLLMIGLEGQELTPEARSLMLDVRPGGIILFKRNVEGGPEQVAGLVRACQDLALAEFGRPLLVAIDQEGGPVRRLSPPFSVLPSQREMAETLTAEDIRCLGVRSGRELAAVGVNFNLTPVLDLNIDRDACFMAQRSFGPDPDLAATLGLALMDGHAEQGVLTCAKHFPGIGDTRLDPHEELPTVGHPIERLRRLELIPFVRAISRGLAAVMTSHVIFPALDPDRPATFSSIIQTSLLRKELGFEGLLLTDDLEMGAIVRHGRVGSAAVKAVEAGADLALICHRADRIIEARDELARAVRAGLIPTRRLDATSARLDAALAKLTRPEPDAWRTVGAYDS